MNDISYEDETFRISEDLDSAPILKSLAKVGQLNPVILLERMKRSIIVCGFRRFWALKRLNENQISARILAAEDWDLPRAFELALWDNLSHRQLNPLEKARVLIKLRDICGIDDEKLTTQYLPALGLSPNPNVLVSYILLNGIHAGLRQGLLEGRLTHASVESLSSQPPQVQACIASLMDRIRLSASTQRKILNELNDLASMGAAPLDAPLNEPDVRAILEDSALSPFQRGEKVYEHLYRLTHPRISRATERFETQKKRLRLPGSIRIEAHPFFEDPGVQVAFSVPDADRFRRMAAALQSASQSPELDELFHVD